MFCIQCGTFNPDTAAFCGKCGWRFDQAASPAPENVVNLPITPSPQVQVSDSPQSLSGEIIPIMQETLPASGFLPSQESPLVQGNVQTWYGIPQSDQPSAPSSSLPFEPTKPYLPPYGAPEAPPTPPPTIEEPWYKVLPKPMPLWAFIGSIVAVVVLLVVLQVTGSDWAAGAERVGIVAGILALVIALATVVRILLGMVAKTNSKRVIQLVSAGLAILLLLLLSLVGLTQQYAIHGLQAHSWEGQQQWQTAINEYQLAGEGAPTSENIARVYNMWGEQLNAKQRYQDAVARFNIVMNNYGSASTGVARARSDTIKSYLAWGQQASQKHDYMAATSHYDDLLQLSYCTANCQSQGNALDATSYYNLAESQLATKDYTDAINNFQVVVSRFASSPEVQKSHGDYARALLGHGQQQFATSCPSAIPTYQQLSTQFGDTPEGQQATRALKAPQPVKGHFTGFVPNDPALTPTAALMHGLSSNMSDSQFYQMLSGSPTVTIQNNGTFYFPPLKQGSYELAWGSDRSDGARLYVYYANGNSLEYVATVGPLCAFDFGNINRNIPTP
jgi:TolA-binding protein